MSTTIIPNIEEIRAISEERNKKDIKDYMDQIRTAMVNGIQQDARDGHDRHVHTWMDTGKTNLTTRTSKIFKRLWNNFSGNLKQKAINFVLAMEGHMRDRNVSLMWLLCGNNNLTKLKYNTSKERKSLCVILLCLVSL